MRFPILQHLSLLLGVFLLTCQAFCQSSFWNPIPLGQTSYFEQSQTSEILSMECDWSYPGGSGDFYEICYDQMQEHFDSCAFQVWTGDFQQNPFADFRGFVHRPEDITVRARDNEFVIPLYEEVGSSHFFGPGWNIVVEPMTLDTVFGVEDSVKNYSLIIVNIQQQGGIIKLSKNHGLLEFTPFKFLDCVNTSSFGKWVLAGYEQSGQQGGLALPDKADYFPYSIGDELLLEENGHRANDMMEFEPYTDLLSIEITSVDTSDLTIDGIVHRYNSVGVFQNIDSSFSMTFHLLRQMLENPYSVPHLADISPIGSQYATLIPSYPHWMDTGGDSGIVVSTGGFQTSHCDSNIIVDGVGVFQDYSAELGLVYSYDRSLAGPPLQHNLLAAEGQNFSHGSWPVWLSVPKVADEEMISVYPNPAKDRVVIAFEKSSSMRLSVLNASGSEVLNRQVRNREELDVSNLSAGVYFFRLSDASNVEVKRVIVH